MIDGQEADKQKLYYIDKTGKLSGNRNPISADSEPFLTNEHRNDR